MIFTTVQQKGLCLREKFVCNRRKYNSPGFNLYKEVDSRKRGRKAASANVGINAALTQTPFGPSSIRRLCLGSNILAPSRSSVYTSAGKVCKVIERINCIDMKTKEMLSKRSTRIETCLKIKLLCRLMEYL